MSAVVTGLLVLAVVGIVGFAVGLTLRSKKDFAEQNEVVPGVPSPAPASWAGAHSREARLHRRLGAAVRGVREQPRVAELGLAEQTRAIEAEALAIDERLVAASGLPEAHRQGAVDAIEAHVVELEQTIADMVTSVTVADTRELLDAAVSDADLRLRALAEARAEVERVDRAASGVVDTPQAHDLGLSSPPPSDTPTRAEGETGTSTG